MLVKRNITLSLFIIFTLTTLAYAQVKKADLAGTWYPGFKGRLLAQLNGYMDKAQPPEVTGKIIALISPHAGYVFSGPVAAYGFKAIKGMDIDTAVVVGFSHGRYCPYYDGIAVFDGEGYETPLGVAPIDREVTKELIAQHEKIYSHPQAFTGENGIEMQIPFLQATLKDAKLVLIAMGDQTQENSEITAKALHNVLKKRDKFLLVGSTDMSHFLRYDNANKMDKATISVIEKFDPKELYAESVLGSHQLMCGYGAICATMLAAKYLGADKIKILKYANSGDTAGNKKEVVGYLSAAMYKENTKLKMQNSKAEKEGENQMLSEKQKKRLLKIARDTMETYVKTGKRLEFKESDPTLNREMGAFVTVHKRGQLRGCIGNIIGRGPLYLTVRDMAIQSSTEDPRFPAVTASELKDIDIEISVLSELEEIDDPNVIEMGKHGVLVRSGFRSGVYLPQVATETGWSRDEFMSSLCGQKAGIPPDAWKTGKCKIYVFTAEVFGEKE